MLKLNDYKHIFTAIGLIGILLIASPVIVNNFKLTNGEKYTELYLLGPGHDVQNYPYIITPGKEYGVTLGITNYMNSFTYYLVTVKLLNESDSLPNRQTGSPSQVTSLYSYRISLNKEQTWENPINFIFQGSSANNQSVIDSITINNIKFILNKPAVWNATSQEFRYQLLFELWQFNSTSGDFQFNNQFVNLLLNYTQTA